MMRASPIWALGLLAGVLTGAPAESVWNSIAGSAQADAFPVGLQVGSNRQWAVAFQPAKSCRLESIALPLSATGAPATVVAALAADDHGVPGAVLATFAIGRVDKSTPALQTFKSKTALRLDARKRYWIIVGTQSPAPVVWSYGVFSSPNEDAPVFCQNSGAQWLSVPGGVPGAVVMGVVDRAVAIAWPSVLVEPRQCIQALA
jgi:hypothetical protein